MGRRHARREGPERPAESWETERTLAAAEEEQGEASDLDVGSETRCLCGSSEFLLEAYLRIVDGKPDPRPVEVETLTCPECGREFEAIQTDDGRVLRGEFLGQVDLDE